VDPSKAPSVHRENRSCHRFVSNIFYVVIYMIYLLEAPAAQEAVPVLKLPKIEGVRRASFGKSNTARRETNIYLSLNVLRLKLLNCSPEFAHHHEYLRQ
jgi:hypothetical protein